MSSGRKYKLLLKRSFSHVYKIPEKQLSHLWKKKKALFNYHDTKFKKIEISFIFSWLIHLYHLLMNSASRLSHSAYLFSYGLFYFISFPSLEMIDDRETMKLGLGRYCFAKTKQNKNIISTFRCGELNIFFWLENWDYLPFKWT